MSDVASLMSNAYVDPWDVLNIFCFHVYAEMLMFMGENDNALSTDIRVSRAGKKCL